MARQSSPNSTPAGMPVVAAASLGRLVGVHLHFATNLDLQNALAANTADPLWADGSHFTISSETGTRRFDLAGNHVRNLDLLTGKRIRLGANTCVATAVTGTPTGGNPTDVAINYTAGIYWTNTAGTWVNSGSIFPAMTLVPLTGATTLYADLHGVQAGVLVTFSGASANFTLATDTAAAAANRLPWTPGNGVEVSTLDGSVGVPTIVTPDGKSITGSTTKPIGANCKAAGSWDAVTTDPSAATVTLAGATDVSTVNLPALNTPLSTAFAAKADLVAGKVPAAQLPSYVDDVLEFANQAALPALGETGKIYVTLDTNYEYRWGGSAYIRLVASPGSSDAVPEGTTNLYFSAARAQAAVTPTTLNLGNVNNTADSAKPVSTAQATAISAAQAAAVAAVTPTSLGLGNVNNTSDSAKPVSTAQSAAISAAQTAATAAIPAQVQSLAAATNLARVDFHFESWAALQFAVAAEQARVAANTPRWPDGTRLNQGTAPNTVTMIWSVASNHARLASFGSGKTLLLGTDTSVVQFGTGAPGAGVGNNGDGYVDWTLGVWGPKASGVWPATPVISFTSSGSTFKGVLGAPSIPTYKADLTVAGGIPLDWRAIRGTLASSNDGAVNRVGATSAISTTFISPCTSSPNVDYTITFGYANQAAIATSFLVSGWQSDQYGAEYEIAFCRNSGNDSRGAVFFQRRAVAPGLSGTIINTMLGTGIGTSSTTFAANSKYVCRVTCTGTTTRVMTAFIQRLADGLWLSPTATWASAMQSCITYTDTAPHVPVGGCMQTNFSQSALDVYVYGLSVLLGNRLPFVHRSAPVLTKGGTYDGIFADALAAPGVCFDGTRFVMTLSIWNTAAAKWYSGHFTSPDLVSWAYVPGSLLSPANSDYINANGAIAWFQGRYYLVLHHYPQGGAQPQPFTIQYSTDLVNWTVVSYDILNGLPYAADPSLAVNPTNGRLELYYPWESTASDITTRVMRMSDSSDGFNFVDRGVMHTTSQRMSPANTGAYAPFYIGSSRYMIMDSSLPGSGFNVGYRYTQMYHSDNQDTNWVFDGPVNVPNLSAWEAGQTFDAFAIVADTGDGRGLIPRILYAGSDTHSGTDNTNSSIGLAYQAP